MHPHPCAYAHTYTHARHTCTHIQASMHAYPCAVHLYMIILTNGCIHAHICAGVHTCAPTYTLSRACTFLCVSNTCSHMRAHTHLCMFVHMCSSLYTLYTYLHTFLHRCISMFAHVHILPCGEPKQIRSSCKF